MGTICKILKFDGDTIVFTNGYTLESYHNQDCCENHYLDFNNIEKTDYEELEFDLSNRNQSHLLIISKLSEIKNNNGQILCNF